GSSPSWRAASSPWRALRARPPGQPLGWNGGLGEVSNAEKMMRPWPCSLSLRNAALAEKREASDTSPCVGGAVAGPSGLLPTQDTTRRSTRNAFSPTCALQSAGRIVFGDIVTICAAIVHREPGAHSVSHAGEFMRQAPAIHQVDTRLHARPGIAIAVSRFYGAMVSPLPLSAVDGSLGIFQMERSWHCHPCTATRIIG